MQPIIITYLRTGRHVRSSGEVISSYDDGLLKVKPNRAGWGAIVVTPAEINAGKEKPPIIPRKKSDEAPPKRERKPKPEPLPRWKQLVTEVRVYEADHHPEGWPAVKMKFLTSLADELEAAQTLFQQK